MSESEAPTGALPRPRTEERHASWLELFFDLVAAAGVAQLAHRLHGADSWQDGAAYLGLFLAFWIAWVTFTLYASVASDTVRSPTMYLAMFGTATMAAAVPQATGDHGTVFAVAFVLVRLLSLRVWGRRQEALAEWPSAQLGTGILPWVVSIWVEGPWRYGMWGLGLALDIGLPLVLGGRRTPARPPGEPVPERGRLVPRRQGHPARPGDGAARRVVRLDAGHIDERLGLFTIIVLGEGVAQLVAEAAAAQDWHKVAGIALAAFVLLICLWRLTFRYGFTGVPHISLHTAPARAVLPAHFVTIAALAAAASGLGQLAAAPGDAVSTTARVTLCAGLGSYFLVAALGGVIGRSSGFWLTGWSWPGLLLCLAIGLFGEGMEAQRMVWCLNAVLLWNCSYEQVTRRRQTMTSGG